MFIASNQASKQKEKNMLSKDIGRITNRDWNTMSLSEYDYQFKVENRVRSISFLICEVIVVRE